MIRTIKVPRSLVDSFLQGRASPGEPQRFTQDAGIVADVWLGFAEDLNQPRRVLIAPIDGAPAVEVASLLHDALRRYREGPGARLDPLLADPPPRRDWTSVAPLESFVAVTLYFDELIRVVMPLTQWWRKKNLDVLREPQAGAGLRKDLKAHVADRLGPPPKQAADPGLDAPATGRDGKRLSDWKVLESTSIVALIGLLALATRRPEVLESLSGDVPQDEVLWTQSHAEGIAEAAVVELGRPTEAPMDGLPSAARQPHDQGLIQRVFLDRPCRLADAEATCTVKADAAQRVFDISCRSLTWAIIDSGVAATHPAFDAFETGPDGRQVRTAESRVRAAYDLTLIDRIRNFDLTTGDTTDREGLILDIIRDLRALPGPRATGFDRTATTNLRQIGVQLSRRLLPDWALIEPLIRIQTDDGTGLHSDHGTHVAGILAGDWRETPAKGGPDAKDEVVLQGICPDISIYDLRVLHPRSLKNSEFAVIAALEFIRHLNSRAAGPPLIHGANISLSIPHEVRNYGCGVTPVCLACDDLVQSGVVVVAAAGNRGWNERELGFGNFVFCSITDPGNAQRVITVGATHRVKPHTYGVSYFSSRGPTGDGRSKPDLVAPGEKIRGPIRGGADDELDGTSMAAPFVSGAAAMLMARNRELMRNPLRIKELLCENATDLGRERYFQGHGLVDVCARCRRFEGAGVLFSLEVLPAKEGDCLILHWGDDPAVAVIDGGPPGVFAATLGPRLQEMRRNLEIERLVLSLVMVSHVDSDHIVGVAKLLSDLKSEHEANTPLADRPLQVQRLWHNTFADVLGRSIDAYYAEASTAALQAAVTGDPDPEALAAALEAAGLNGVPDHEAFDLALVLAGHRQGRQLRDDFEILRDAGEIDFRLNAPFTRDGEPAAIRRIPGQAPVSIDGLTIRVVGPSESELERLQQDFRTYLVENGLALPAALAALASADQDESPTNLSSLVCLVEHQTRRVLLTGDALGDSILAGLSEMGELTDGRLHVEVLKVPHHGSARNASQAFFDAITADAYVFSGNGKHENPDRETIEWVIASREPGDAYRLVFTYDVATIDTRREAVRRGKGKPWDDAADSIAALLVAERGNGHVFSVSEGRTVLDLGDDAIDW